MLYEIILALIIVGSLVLVIAGNRKPYISIFWILFIVLLPGVGTIFYLLLGKDYRSRRVIKADELARFDALRDKSVGVNVVEHRQRHPRAQRQRGALLHRLHPHVPVDARRHLAR